MKLEVRIPISPTGPFINRTRLLAAAVRRWVPDAVVTVSCHPRFWGDDPPGMEGHDCYLAKLWANTRWRGVPEELTRPWRNTRSPYLATMMSRYKPPFYGDYILMLDADVVPVGDFSELFGFDGLQGVQAHHSPYGVAGWVRLFEDFGLSPPSMSHQYSGWGVMECRELERRGPFYPNSGMIFGPRKHFEALAEPFAEAIEFLRANVSDTYWFDQVGFALGCALANIPVRSLPLRWNFPNRPAFDAAFPTELAEIRFLHAMQSDVVDRDQDFANTTAMRQLAARSDLTGSNEVLRRAVEELMPAAFPEPAPLSCAEDAPYA